MRNPNLLKALFTCMVIAFCANLLMAQETESIKNLNNFNKIVVSSGINLYISQANTEKIVLKGSKDVLSKVSVTKSKDGVLILQIDKSGWGNLTWGDNDQIRAYVSVKQLESLSVSGGSDVYSEGNLNLKDITIKASGGSDLKLSLNANALKVTSSGGSDVALKGTVKYLGIDASGGSDVDAFLLIADEVSLAASGGSDSKIFVKQTLKIVASGASDVSYKGNPPVKRISASGASDVHHTN